MAVESNTIANKTGTAARSARFTCPFDQQEFDTLSDLQDHIMNTHAKTSEMRLFALTINGRHQEVHVEAQPDIMVCLAGKTGDYLSQRYVQRVRGLRILHGDCEWPSDLSCMTLAIDCDGATIETAEGIADAGHPLIEAYVDLYAMQCGYCTPGFVVTAKALLDRNPRPTEADIREALGGNLCKCSSYPAHIKAVLTAAQKLWEKKNEGLEQ